MSETLLPMVEDEWKKAPVSHAEPSLITSLALVEGDVLAYLERQRTTTLRHLVRELEWPSRLILMGLGALVREGLVRAVQRELEFLVELQPVRTRQTAGSRG